MASQESSRVRDDRDSKGLDLEVDHLPCTQRPCWLAFRDLSSSSPGSESSEVRKLEELLRYVCNLSSISPFFIASCPGPFTFVGWALWLCQCLPSRIYMILSLYFPSLCSSPLWALLPKYSLSLIKTNAPTVTLLTVVSFVLILNSYLWSGSPPLSNTAYI